MKVRKIILVDDKAAYRNAVKELLKKLGKVEIVAEAPDGKTFLEQLKTHSPDIIFMDIEMPEMNGIEATKLAIEQNPDLVIIGLSMYHDEKYIDELIQVGARGYLLKLSDNTNIFRTIIKYPTAEIFFSKEIEYKRQDEKASKKNILIVDDFESTRQVIDFTFSQIGYGVIQADCGSSALERLKNNEVDLIITDYHMPGMNGIELATKIRQIPELVDVPILLLTTELKKETRDAARQAGITGRLIKPFTMDKLINFVKKALR